ncbi:hypothetical protein MKW92_030572, partial [Papaver armeniacum]
METIHLPSLRNWMELDGFYIQDCVLSSPVRGGNDGDTESMVFFIIGAGESPEYTIVFCSVGDTKWCKHEFIDESPNSIDYFNGKLYAMCLNNPHLEIETRHGSDKTLSISEFNIADSTPYTPGLQDSAVVTYYVPSCGEIFKIRIHGNPRGVYMQVFAINIWKVNLSLLALEEVKSLDDHVIFLGRTTVLSYSAAELGYTKGCVYFTQSDEMSLYKYEVDDKSLFLSLPCPDLPSPWFSSNWVMIPSTLRSADSIQKTHYVKCKKDEEDSSMNAEESKIGAKIVEADLIQKLNG